MSSRKSETISTILSMVNLKHLIFAITEVSRELFSFNKFQSNLRNNGKHGLLFIIENKSITCSAPFAPVVQGSKDYLLKESI